MSLLKVVWHRIEDATLPVPKTFCFHVLLGSFLLWGLTASAAPPPAGVAPIGSPAGGFGIDGDVCANTPITNVGDWLMATTFPGTGAGVLSATGVALDPIHTFHFVDPYNANNDTTFVGGLKWTDNPNSWQWTTGKASGKTDINNVLLHLSTDADGHIWVAIAADRYSTSGDSYIDFEFLQNSLVRSNNGSFVSAGTNGGRTVNDLLLNLAFTAGGKVADFFAWQWRTNSGAGGFEYVDVTTSLPTGRVFAALNSNVVAVPYGAFGSTNYAPNAFAEAAVDLTGLLGNFDQCLSFGFKTIMVKTKTSTASTATIADFIDPIQYSFKIGPSSDAGPDQTRCVEGTETAFPLHGVATAGLQPIASTTWSVISGSATIDAPSSLITTARLSSVTATLRLTVLQSNACTETDDIVLWVAPLPVCSITGSSLVCPRSTNQFRGPAGMNAYSWSLSGNGSLSGATNAQTVTVIAGGGCNTNFTLTLNVISNACPSSCSFDVLVNDTTSPSLTIPGDKILECPADTRTNVNGVATAQDDCGQVFVSYSDETNDLCANTKIISRTWTATDLCGNATSKVQTITVRDTIRPTLVCPPNRTLECPADTNATATGLATATDGCGPVTVTFTDAVSNTCGGGMVISRLWLATDACGNTSNCLQTITLRDTTRPSLIIPANVTLDCPANTTTNNTGTATAYDACSAVTISYSDATTNNCSGTKVIARTWTATDDCGNSTNRVQTITVRDISKPTLTCPPDVALECPADTSTNNTGMAIAVDTCSAVIIRYSDSVTNQCGGTKTLFRTWTATDGCSNSVSCVQTITVKDTTAPVLTMPANTVLECPADTRTNVTGVATAQDACSSVTIRYSDVTTTNCTGTKVIARTWTATDACGNATNALQTITVLDTLRPSLVCPTNIVLECPADTRTNVTGVATATDGCNKTTVSYSDSVVTNCGGTKVIARTWTAADECGNSTNRTQTITVVDTRKPTIVCPTNRVLDCPADISTNNTGAATAQDGCSAVTITYSDSVSNGCGGSRLIARTWTATDQCGNNISCVQTITVRDITPPAITCPADVVLECPANTSTNNTGVPTATDGCGSVALTFTDSVSTNCGGTKVITRLWTATDPCGNHASCTQTITVRDTTPPAITCPPNLTLECPAITTTNVTGVATATDGCGAVTIRYVDSVTNTCGGGRIIGRLWTATDACNNSASCQQIITVRDSSKPVLTLPPDVTLECPNTSTTTNFTGVATATDTCSSFTIRYSDVVTTNCGATRVIARTWTATDSCSNSAAGVQTITVRDSTKPTITCPPDLTLDCPANISTNVTGVATGQDTCGSVTIRYSDSSTTPCGGTKVISRLWTATDACGNTSSCTQRLTIRDTVPPVISCPPDVTLECGSSTSPSATGYATATDTCSTPKLTYTDSITNLCGGSKIIRRTWTANDGCDNVDSCVQTITVIDTTPPDIKSSIIICTYSQGGWGGGGDPAQILQANFISTFTNGLVLGVYYPSNGNAAPNGLFWQPNSSGLSALRSCLGSASGSGTITQDAINPTSTYGAGSLGRQTLALHFNVTFNTVGVLGSAPNNYASLIYTNSGSDSLSGQTISLILAVADQALAGLGLPPGYDVSRLTGLVNDLNIAFEACDKSSWADGHLISPPMVKFVACPAQVPVPNLSEVIASDSCSAVTVSILPDAVTEFLCSSRYTIQRTFLARDACGNTNSFSYFIVVSNTSVPTITCPPNLAVECGQDTTPNATGTATAQDACGSVNVTYSDIMSNTCGGAGVLRRTWTAQGCGATTSCVQLITVRDTTSPTIICAGNKTLPTGVPWNFDDPSATDTCGPTVVTVINTTTNVTATNTLVATRRWQATDACGNTSQCQQTITILPPPIITTQPISQTVAHSSNLTLRVTASGNGPLAYQWQCNGTNVSGATNSFLDLSGMQFTNAGLYCVVISNSGGTVTSTAAVVNVAPKLFSQLGPNNTLELRWPTPFILQFANVITGPYKDVPGATSPYVHLGFARQGFFRLRSQPFSLLASNLAPGQFAIACPGVPGCNFIIQGSTNLTTWLNLKTNTSSFTFVDTNSWQYPTRFYRAILAH